MLKVRQRLRCEQHSIPMRTTVQLRMTQATRRNYEETLPDEGELTEAHLEDNWSSVKVAINNALEGTIGFVERD